APESADRLLSLLRTLLRLSSRPPLLPPVAPGGLSRLRYRKPRSACPPLELVGSRKAATPRRRSSRSCSSCCSRASSRSARLEPATAQRSRCASPPAPAPVFPFSESLSYISG